MSSKPLRQVVWLSVDAPASGKSRDFAASLMQKWDDITQEERFTSTLQRGPRNGPQMLNEWRQVASSQFLGLLHIDEIQNLFKNPPLAKRRLQKSKDGPRELSLVEDGCLKLFMNLLNTNHIPLLFSGTPDGISALTKRLATTQRMTTGGYHHFAHFPDANHAFYRKALLGQLMKYQFVAKPLTLTDQFAQLIIELSGGLLRVIIALWVAAHRIAFERNTDDLRLEDFKVAANTFLAPLLPAIRALRSGDAKLIASFDDMIQQDEQFWASFWTPAL